MQVINQESTDSGAAVFTTRSGVFNGTSYGSCRIDASGNLACTGTKSAVVPVNNGRMVALYAVEAPQNWFEDIGNGRLLNGAATITLDDTFAQTVNTSAGYHVFLTPGEDCEENVRSADLTKRVSAQQALGPKAGHK